jgi:hypothetical protein
MQSKHLHFICKQINRQRDLIGLNNILLIYTNAHQKDWNVYLPYILHAYQTNVHISTKKTPYFLIYKRNVKIPLWLDILKIDKNSKDIVQYKEEMLSKIEKVYENTMEI